ncbi:flagellar basal body-associated FliL family protein [Nocardioides marmoribigeumensis]|jgi:flagellar FliL protein|uniref:Flagellar protein FliL n=1 Tax=Nocardioides marmoribigeumensis TaxID=433649 RepID=A0ABU2BTY0_9ACTN|nr:flagellar basal body-associated FliL family protein [Nocardioides marmoribigeumensis]MDR7362080.1 flagellar FliL protein [Nocardioides marmoribigeumensis]
MSATTVAPAGQAAPPAEETTGGGKKKLVMIVVLLLLVGGAAYWFVLKPKPAGADEPKPGEVVRLDPIQVNLSGGHYLKIGIALQLTATAHEADGSMALDATIDTFSGRSMDALTRPDNREKLKAHLEKELEHRYHGDVMGVYFTDFVTQ